MKVELYSWVLIRSVHTVPHAKRIIQKMQEEAGLRNHVKGGLQNLLHSNTGLRQNLIRF